ncbi:hypothetical protein PGH47_21740 [Streptomyces sp. HUAS 31]|uniref:hypothetical protein n=1 Tax=Streptomyces TaxID=1883 RepID=UPI002306BEB9|nr:hypothetical protein [Streptomyces sp. HUAS 31]WCD98141.1 hypothetical protein PGH47_21740 [Streptomyces sp. HUAS 31]
MAVTSTAADVTAGRRVGASRTPEDALGFHGGVVHWGFGLLVLAWLLPHRRSLRTARLAAAVTGLVCVLLPLALMLLIGLVTASA